MNHLKGGGQMVHEAVAFARSDMFKSAVVSDCLMMTGKIASRGLAVAANRRDGSGLLPATVSRWRGRDHWIAHVHQFRAPRVFFAYGIGEDAPQFIVGGGDGSCESTTVTCGPFTRNRHHCTPFIRRYRRTDFLTCRNCARRTCDDQHHGNGDISDRVFHGFRS